MKELKKFCNTCDEEKDIIIIETDAQGEIIELSCGHKHISHITSVTLHLSAYTRAEHKNSQGRLLSRQKTKKSGKTQRPAKEYFEIDRDNQKLIHKVWEQNQSEEWILVHDEEKPFPSKKSD